MSVPKLTPTDVVVRSVRYGYRFSFASKAAGAADGIANAKTAAIAAVNPQNLPRIPRCLKAFPASVAPCDCLRSQVSFSRQTSG